MIGRAHRVQSSRRFRRMFVEDLRDDVADPTEWYTAGEECGYRRLVRGIEYRRRRAPLPARREARGERPEDVGTDRLERERAGSHRVEAPNTCVGESLGIPYENLIARLLQILGEVSPAAGRAKDYRRPPSWGSGSHAAGRRDCWRKRSSRSRSGSR